MYPIPAAIAGDCSRDVTQEIVDWITSVPDNATLVFGRGACYRIERTVYVRGRTGFVIEGNDATFRRTQMSPLELQYPRGNRHFAFMGGSNIIIRNLRVEGTNTVTDGAPGFGSYRLAFEFEHAFAIQGVDGLVIENVSIDAVWGDGIYLGALNAMPSPIPTRNARISHVTIDRNGRQGIAITHAVGVLVEDARILHSRRSGFDLEPVPGWSVNGVEIRASYINSRLLAFASAGSRQVANVYIHHNTIESSGVPWVYVRASDRTRRYGWRVYDNRVLSVLGSPVAALYFVNIDNVDVRRNTSHLARWRYMKGVDFQNAGSALYIIDNDFSGACAAYVADAQTGPVVAYGNIFTTGCVLPLPR